MTATRDQENGSRLTSMANEIHAASAAQAADKTMDPAAAYKRKIFYRRLKASLLGLTALTLLLAGCLLGFVLPASLEVAGQERGNSTNRNDAVEGLVALGNNSSATNSSTSVTPLQAPVGPQTTLSPAQPQADVTKGRPTKFWALNWHDSIQKQNKQNMMATTPMPTVPTTSPSSYKWWLLHWKEHVENALQKNKQRNGTTEGSGSDNGKRPQPRTFAPITVPTTTTAPTTISSAEELRAKLAANNTSASVNQTTRANVRRVTSYPKSNITTTPPSVITRKV